MPGVYPRGTFNVSSLGSFFSVGSSLKTSHPPLPISLVLHRIQEYFKKKRGGGSKIHQATGGEGQARAAYEENEGDSTSEVDCW